MAPTLDLRVQPGLEPGATLAEDRAALAAAARGTASLRVWTLATPTVSLGRWHLAPRGDAGGAVRVARRLSGGRVWAAGPGFVGVSLALPGRDALGPGLRPEQVMNRALRGVLRALEALGVPAVYPGRDLVTVGGRPLATAAFEEDDRGVVLCETVLAAGADLAALPRLLDAVDPDGAVSAPAWGPADVASIAAVAGGVPPLAALADALGAAHAAALGMALRPVPAAAPEPPADAAAWLAERRLRPGLDRRGTVATQLGMLDVWFRTADGRIADVLLAGDVIAPSSTVPAVEAALVACPLERAALARAVEAAVAGPGRFLLGVWPLDAVADAVLRGAA